MVNEYLNIFYEVCIAMIPLIPAVLGVYMVVKLVSDLFFKDK